MFDDLYLMVDGVPYAHPVLVLLATLAGAQIPNIVRLSSNLRRLWPH